MPPVVVAPVPAPLVVVVQKPWYSSKVLWFNVITMISLAGVILAGVKLSTVQLETVGAVVAAANAALRLWFTGAPITDIATAVASVDVAKAQAKDSV